MVTCVENLELEDEARPGLKRVGLHFNFFLGCKQNAWRGNEENKNENLLIKFVFGKDFLLNFIAFRLLDSV